MRVRMSRKSNRARHRIEYHLDSPNAEMATMRQGDCTIDGKSLTLLLRDEPPVKTK